MHAHAVTPLNTRPLFGRILFAAATTTLMLGLFLFLPAGRLDWWAGWVVLLLFILGNFGILLLLLRVDPELANERIEVPAEIRPWDRWLTSIPKLLLFLVLLPLAGLGVRFNWSASFPAALQWAAVAVFGLMQVWTGWAMLSNRFFAAAVRIQLDRGHQVITGGPYRFIRHPGYAGWIVQMLAAPLALGSWWGLIPGVLSAGLYVARTALEDAVLQRELPGYREYTQNVRFRLLPGVW